MRIVTVVFAFVFALFPAAGCQNQRSMEAPSKGADNSYCLVCHFNYRSEEITTAHAAAGFGCAHCHGESGAHSQDEDNRIAPDRMFAVEAVNGSCMTCHVARSLTAVEEHEPVVAPGATATDGVCTDCHGSHRLSVRTRRWDKATGRMIMLEEGPRMDRP